MSEGWRERVVEEKRALDEKISRLESFLISPEFQGVAPGQYKLLLEQLALMRSYSHVLLLRLAAQE